jgi:hypothetical protein
MQLRIVKSGNCIVDGQINDENLKKSIKKINKRAFGNKIQEVKINYLIRMF